MLNTGIRATISRGKPETQDRLRRDRSYILSVYLGERRRIEIGKLGEFLFKRGNYLYVGSGKKNIEKRIERHLKREKKIFWHIDYLLRYANVRGVWVSEREESEVARTLESLLEIPVPGFGSSDKRHDRSHLFYGNLPESLLGDMDFLRFIPLHPR
ncbi:hypothetical protein CH333_08105 [candidate division WOR-3 bacterium JGI_Cruoil_03_44_89]|uniref:GIY-YIG domain-containing protein n=1 Tax=candidate division WOR-3 bacterium JGI_Cruoil_03_44_89 TaxID=1973748 RepID=A0A235BPG5_UNCW3|nr:MAG: hypothetical protein CH333_08105 [candidate division WOR-3 bacterium JGI_Cruoil_03_44_89]